jgi:hypothetical protein
MTITNHKNLLKKFLGFEEETSIPYDPLCKKYEEKFSLCRIRTVGGLKLWISPVDGGGSVASPATVPTELELTIGPATVKIEVM